MLCFENNTQKNLIGSGLSLWLENTRFLEWPYLGSLDVFRPRNLPSSPSELFFFFFLSLFLHCSFLVEHFPPFSIRIDAASICADILLAFHLVLLQSWYPQTFCSCDHYGFMGLMIVFFSRSTWLLLNLSYEGGISFVLLPSSNCWNALNFIYISWFPWAMEL